MDPPSSTYITPLNGNRDDSKCMLIAFAVVVAIIALAWIAPNLGGKENFDRRSGMNRMAVDVDQPGQSYRFRG